MAQRQRKIPMRKDIVTGEMLPKKELVRVVKNKENEVAIDPTGKQNGRGAYIHLDVDVAKQAKEEKTFTLRYAKQLQSKLKKAGARVYMTRDSDKTVSLSKRPELAEKVHADAFISFHFDSSPQDNSASGYTTYYYHKDNGSFRLAKDINSQLTSLGLDNRGVDFGNFLVLRDNTQPAVLLESGYINSDRDLSFIDDSSYENKVTNDVVKGLQLYFEGKDENALIANDPN